MLHICVQSVFRGRLGRHDVDLRHSICKSLGPCLDVLTASVPVMFTAMGVLATVHTVHYHSERWRHIGTVANTVNLWPYYTTLQFTILCAAERCRRMKQSRVFCIQYRNGKVQDSVCATTEIEGTINIKIQQHWMPFCSFKIYGDRQSRPE